MTVCRARGLALTVGRDSTLAVLLLATTALTSPFLIAAAHAQNVPTGGSVAAGSVAIAQPSATQLNITQSSQSAVVNWQSFSVGQGSAVNIAQPNASSAILNRVTSSTPSTIAGQVNANGQVYLVNPNGIAITRSGTVNTGGGFVASTLGISDADFQSGKRTFNGNGASAGVSNAGAINVGRGGYAALIGGTVSNSGSINVPLGKVGLGSGERATLDFSGDGFLQVAVPTSAGGKGALIKNSGSIKADGGSVTISAATAREAARNAINISGVVQARSIGGRSGGIVIGGGGGGRVKISGRLDASSRRHSGGTIQVTGQSIKLKGATVDASGKTGGGTINIGGGRQGSGPLQHADATTVDANAVIKADAITSGNGGNVVVWSDQLTIFAGTISAKGGANSGNGGEAEVSGKAKLAYTGFADLSASHGNFGTLLLDPYDVVISNDANSSQSAATGGGTTTYTPNGTSVINVGTLQTALASANVTVTTGAAGSIGGDVGNITVADPVTWSSGSMLTLTAANGIFINVPVTITGGGKLALNATYDTTIVSGQSLLNLSFGTLGSVSYAAGSGSGVAGQSLSINGTPYTLLYTYAQVQAINASSTALQGSYALARTLSNTVDISKPAHWAPIGTDAIATVTNSGLGFSGAFEGLGNTLNSIVIDATSQQNFVNSGVFGYSSGTIRDLRLVNASVNFTIDFSHSITNAGGLAGQNTGVIANVSNTSGGNTTGSSVGGLVGFNNGGIIINASFVGFEQGVTDVGGLVGRNTGTILRSFVAGATTVRGNQGVGGLVGNNSGTVTDVYSVATVTDYFSSTPTSGYGGLAGINSGSISNAFGGGAVGGGNPVTDIGGLVGLNSGGGTITNSYLATSTSNRGSGSGIGTNSGAGSVGDLTNAQLSAGLPGGFSPSVWGNVGNQTSPYFFTNRGPVYYGSDSYQSRLVFNMREFQAISSAPSANYILANNLDGTNFAGFAPTANFSGIFNGLNHTISNLNISGGNSTGVFGGNSGTIKNVGIVGGSVQGGNFVGGLVGGNGGLIVNSYATNAVSGSLDVGGLVGQNVGTVTSSYSAGSVNGGSTVGGLIGLLGAQGHVSDSYSLSSVNGGTNVGGLVGEADAQGFNNQISTITNSFAAGPVSGGSFVGAFLGFDLGGTYSNVYWNTDVTGLPGVGRTFTQGSGGPGGGIATGVTTSVLQSGVLLSGFSNTAWNSVAGFYPYLNSQTTVTGTYATSVTVDSPLTGSINTLLASKNVVLNTVGAGSNITVVAPLSWSTTASLTLNSSGALAVNAPITGTGTLALSSNGATTQSAPIVANALLLRGPGSFTLNDAGNQVGTLAANVGSVAFDNSASLTLGKVADVGGIVTSGVTATGAATVIASGDLTIAEGARVSGSNVTLAATSAFINNQGVDAVSATGGGRWLIYSSDPTADTFGPAGRFLNSGNSAIFSKTFATLAPADVSQSGNRYIFANTPPLVLTITSLDQGDRSYGDTSFLTTPVAGSSYSVTGSPSVAGAFTGVTLADVANGSPILTFAGFGTVANASATPYTIAVDVSGLTSSLGYSFVAVSTGIVRVVPAALTVTADAQSRFYGDINPTTGTATGNNLRNGDTIINVALSSPATPSDNVGSYDLTGSAATFGTGLASNYVISYATRPNGLAVTPRPLTVTADAQSRTYGDTNPASGTAAGNNLVNGDTIANVALSSTATPADNVGNYNLTGSAAAFGAGLASNYAITYATRTNGLSVTARPLTITADARSRFYGNANPATGSAVGDNLVNGDTITNVALSSPATTTDNVGSYDLTGSAAAFGPGLASNYAITYATRTNGLAVTARPLTITADARSRVYGDTNPASGTAAGDSLVNGDNISSVNLSSPATPTDNVGSYNLTGSAAIFGSGLASNYAITYATRTNGLGVTARPLMVTANAQSRAYGDPNPALTFQTGGGLVNGDALAGSLTTVDATANVGSYAISQGTLANNNYAITYISANLAVTARPLTVTADARSRIYGDANPASGTAAGDNLVNGDTIGSVSLSSTATLSSNVGAYDLTGSAATFGMGLASNYAITYATRSNGLGVTARPLTITADVQLRTYGDANPANGTASGNNLVNGDAVGNVTLSSPATLTSHVGGYDLTGSAASFGTGLVSNYAITYATRANGLTVTARPLTVTAEAQSRLYGDGNPALTLQTGSGLVNGDTLTGGLATVGVTANVGSYAISQGTLANSDYAINYIGANLVVTARPLTVTANALSRLYGNVNPASGAATGNNLQGSDAISSVSLSSSASAASGVGIYDLNASAVVFSTGLASNYNITYATNANGLMVTPRPVTVTAAAQSRTYGDSNPALTYVTSSLGAGAALSGSLSTVATVTSNVGDYAITAGGVTTAANPNYIVSYVGNNLTIGQRPVTVTADSQTRIYGNANSALTYVTSSLGAGAALSGNLSTAATAASDVGDYAISAGGVTAAANPDYAISYVGSNLTVLQRPVTVTVDAQSRVYGDANPLLTYSSTSLGAGKALVGTLATADPTANVGNYAIARGSLTDAANANYALTYVGNTLAIGQRALTITADAQSRVYADASPATGGATGNNLRNGDSIASVNLSSLASVTSNVGSYDLTASVASFSQGLASNYTIAYATRIGGLTVSPRPLTVTADAQSRIYGDANPALTYVVGGLVNGDALAGGPITAAVATSNVGAYAISQGTLGNSNYAINYAGANLSVTPRPLTVTADAQSRVYGDANPATGKAAGNNLVNGDSIASVSLTSPATSASNVGSYDLTGSAATFGTGLASNYAITYSTRPNGLAITARPLAVTADDQFRFQGFANPALTYRIGGGGLVNGDVLVGGLATSADMQSIAGSYDITRGTLTAGANYRLTYQGAVLTVLPSPAEAVLLASSIVRDNFDAVALPNDAKPVFGAPTVPTALGLGVFYADAHFDKVFVCFGASGSCFVIGN